MRVGDVYSQLTVMSIGETRKAVCRCTCGIERSFWRTNLVTGKSTSCGHSTKTIRIGERYGEWEVIDATKPTAAVRCSCGVDRKVSAYSLLNGDSTSCGHARTRGPRARVKWMWSWMISRCTNPQDPMFPYYGGRGIYVCDEWVTSPDDYIDWVVDQGFKKSAGMQVDRIDNDGPYSPENCRVTTRTVNANNNNPEFHRKVTAFGETKTVGQWSADDRCRCSYSTLWARVNVGWDPVAAVTTPPRHGGGRPKS